jgi:hypothetical protein
MNLSNDEHWIRETINYYYEGMRNDDVEILKKAFS